MQWPWDSLFFWFTVCNVEYPLPLYVAGMKWDEPDVSTCPDLPPENRVQRIRILL